MQARAAIYLDANAGAPLSEAALETLLSFLGTGVREGASACYPEGSSRTRVSGALLVPNASSSHSQGRKAKALLREARSQVARSLGLTVRPQDLSLVSSGTEACQMAIRWLLEPRLLQGEKPHWILGAGDHEAHQGMVAWVEARGGSVSRIPLRADGTLELGALVDLWRPETALVSAIWVNNETGVVTDVPRLSSLCSEVSVPLHLDGAQAWGKLPLDLGDSGAALASFSGHKIGALSGTGVLWRAPRLAVASEAPWPIFPGKQEGGARGGTENLLGAMSLGAAASRVDPEAWQAIVGPLKERLEQAILRQIPGTRIHGAGAVRVANTVNLGFEGVEKDGLVAMLDLAGYCVSSGSACSSGVTEPSHVLKAMGLSEAQARAAVRVSLSAATTWDELEGFVLALADAVGKARRLPSAVQPGTVMGIG